MKEIIPPIIPDADNVAAAPVFAELFDADSGENQDARLVKITGLDYKRGAFPNLKTSELGDLRLYYQRPKFTLTEQEAARNILAELDEEWTPLLVEVAEALQRPQCRWPLAYEKVFFMQAPQILAQLKMSKILRFRALAYLELGETEKALADVEWLFSLKRIDEAYPTMIGLLTAKSGEQLAIEVIWSGLWKKQWQAKELEKIQMLISQQPPLAGIKNSLGTERIAVLHNIGLAKNWRELKNLSVQRQGYFDWLSVLIIYSRPQGWNDFDRCQYAYFSEGLLNGIEVQTGALDVEKIKAVELELEHRFDCYCNMIRTPVTKLTFRGVVSFVRQLAQMETYRSETVIACAVERCRLANGEVPDNLAALVPEYLEKLPVQVVNGKPFIYRKVDADNYVLYSVGWDLRDDGGKFYRGSGKQGDWVWMSRPGLCEELK
ncbi:MAG: hypothetical protein LBK71_10765 [Verrucomicrobiales bacterium]|nr:hypothetical protein [Verrucomicrobiales bacterium]